VVCGVWCVVCGVWCVVCGVSVPFRFRCAHTNLKLTHIHVLREFMASWATERKKQRLARFSASKAMALSIMTALSSVTLNTTGA